MPGATTLNPSTREPLSEQLRQINLNQENIVKIMEAIQTAVTGEAAFVQTDVEDVNGNTVTISIPTNTYLYREVQRISNNMNALAGIESGGTTIIDENSNPRKIVVSSLLRSLPGNLEAITKNEFARIDITSAIHDLIYPCPKMEFVLPTEFIMDKCVVKRLKFNSTVELNQFKEGVDIVTVRQLCERNAIAYTEFTDTYDVDVKTDNFYGSFSILSITHESNGNEVCILDKLTYNDVRTLRNTRSLAVGDMLCDKQGVGVFEIIAINDVRMAVTLRLVTGVNRLSSGVRTLWYQYDAEDVSIVSVPIVSGDKMLVFLAPVNPATNSTSGYTGGFKVNTETLYIVNANSAQVAFDNWFNNTVTNVGAYLRSVAEDAQIPLSMGIKPDRPVLDSSSFHVVQINKHITDTSDVDRIKQLAAEKAQTFAKITTLNKRISEVNTRINTGRYRSTNDKNDDQNLLTTLINEREQQTAVYNALVQDITNKSNTSESLSYEPKFRIRGFWAVQSPISTSGTRNQHIIHYRIEYRYLNARENVSNADAIKYSDNGQFVSGLISAWNEYSSPTLRRELQSDGTYAWSDNDATSDDVISINQCDIAIKPNESVEIRVKACSEAGYPQTMLESEWSEILRIDFPAELLREQSLAQTIQDNNEDKKKIEIEQMLDEKGLLDHVQNSFTENGRYFAHSAHNIASGFYSSEQINISLYEKLQELTNSYQNLYNRITGASAQALIDIVDDAGTSYAIKRNGTTQIFAGYYCDEVNPASETTRGTILEKKYYIRIRNLSGDTMQLFSRFNGATEKLLTVANGYADATKYENVPYVFTNDKEGTFNQYLGQVVYSKNKDIAGNLQLVETPIKTIDFNGSGNFVHAVGGQWESGEFGVYSDGSVVIGKTDAANKYGLFVGVHKQFFDIAGKTAADQLVKTAARYNSAILRKEYTQAEWKEGYVAGNGSQIEPYFNQNDKYLVGLNSCGARLFINPSALSLIQVNGSTAEAYLELLSGEDNALYIPVVFQYRMCDILGNYGMDNVEQTASTNFKYVKKMNVELYLNKKVYEFDLEVSAQFRQTTTSAASISSYKQSIIENAIDTTDTVNPIFK